jgi:hypothetical protein
MVRSGRGERTKDDASMMDGWMDDMMIDDDIKKKKKIHARASGWPCS